MSESPDKRKRGWGTWALAVVVLLALYPLSLGPIAWLHNQGWYLPVPAVLLNPLIFIFDGPEPVAKTYAAYLDWWLPGYGSGLYQIARYR